MPFKHAKGKKVLIIYEQNLRNRKYVKILKTSRVRLFSAGLPKALQAPTPGPCAAPFPLQHDRNYHEPGETRQAVLAERRGSQNSYSGR